MFEINNSQQKSDRGMKISTFPAVKPFIKLTRGRIGREERKAGVTFGEGAGGGSRCRERRWEVGRGWTTSDTGVKAKEVKFVWEGEVTKRWYFFGLSHTHTQTHTGTAL